MNFDDRFASFIEGEAHVLDEELLMHETMNDDMMAGDYEDDDSSDEVAERPVRSTNHTAPPDPNSDISEDDDDVDVRQPPAPGWRMASTPRTVTQNGQRQRTTPIERHTTQPMRQRPSTSGGTINYASVELSDDE